LGIYNKDGSPISSNSVHLNSAGGDLSGEDKRRLKKFFKRR